MKLLIIEDDKNISNTIKQYLIDDYSVEQAFDGYDGYMLAKENIYDAIILDIMLPEMDGYTVLSKLREEKIYTPVLMLTAMEGIDSKIKGFNKGADDYLNKPFEIKELSARISALIRRNTGNYKENELSFKELCLNLNNREVRINGKVLNIQGKQFDILEYLINSKDTIVTKEQIFDKIWGYDSETITNVVEVYTSALRKELKKYNYDKYIRTIRGVGYILSSK